MVMVHQTFEHFLSANGIEDEKKKDVFLTVIRLQTYKLLKSLVAPAKPGEKDYTEEYPLHNINSPATTKRLMVDMIIIMISQYPWNWIQDQQLL